MANLLARSAALGSKSGLALSGAKIDPDLVDELLAEGATLPAAFYTDDEVAKVEDDRIWRRSWQIVGVEPELPKHGDYFTTHISGTFFDVPIVVLRDASKRLRAFVNVCRHRAHFVATGEGNHKALQCTYHGWTYDLDGCLRGVPREKEGGLPPYETLGLYELPLETWAGFIFVAIDPQESLTEALGEFPQVLERNGYKFPFSPENVDPNHEYKRILTNRAGASNWKAQIENAVECYHCPTSHTHSFSTVYYVDADRYLFHNFDRGVYHTSNYRDDIAQRLGLTNREANPPEFQFYYLWPNMTLGGGSRSHVMAGFGRRSPAGVAGTQQERVQYRLPGADSSYDDPELAEYFDEMSRMTAEEDVEITTRVQTGLKSAMIPWGYTLPETERNMRKFYKLVWDALAPAYR